MTREEIVEVLEGLDTCVHAGSPRSVSEIYCYVPVLDAADAIAAFLESTIPPEEVK